MKQSFLFSILFISHLLTAQNFDKVDFIVRRYPSQIENINELANKIDRDFSSDLEKIRALYIYLTNTVEYNINEYKYGADNYSFSYSSREELQKKIRQRDLKIIQNTMSTKKAICEGYSMTFKEVCLLLNIKCVAISGYSRTASTTIGKLPLSGKHAWNAVYWNNKWNFIDTTWGTGYSRDSDHWVKSYDEYFFFTKPNNLITTHFPEKTKWQLLTTKKTKFEFVNQPLYSSLFFSNNLELHSPTTGVIYNDQEFLVLALKNVKPDAEFGYAFKKDYYLTTIIPEFREDMAYLKIPLKEKHNTTLNILLDTEMILQFQIK